MYLRSKGFKTLQRTNATISVWSRLCNKMLSQSSLWHSEPDYPKYLSLTVGVCIYTFTTYSNVPVPTAEDQLLSTIIKR